MVLSKDGLRVSVVRHLIHKGIRHLWPVDLIHTPENVPGEFRKVLGMGGIG